MTSARDSVDMALVGDGPEIWDVPDGERARPQLATKTTAATTTIDELSFCIAVVRVSLTYSSLSAMPSCASVQSVQIPRSVQGRRG